MEGWIKLHRILINWEWFNNSEMVHLFIYCLLRANHSDTSWQGIELKKGQFITSYESLHIATKISFQSLRTCFKKLENTGEISKKTTNKYTILTVCKYDNYQDDQQTTNKQLTNKQQTTNKQLTIDKNEKNEKNEKNNSEKINFISTARNFYDNEISLIEDIKYKTQYLQWIDVIFGKNSHFEPFENVLKMKKQMKYGSFCALFDKFKIDFQLIVKKTEALNYYTGKSSYIEIYSTIKNWCEMEVKKQSEPNKIF